MAVFNDQGSPTVRITFKAPSGAVVGMSITNNGMMDMESARDLVSKACEDMVNKTIASVFHPEDVMYQLFTLPAQNP